VVFEQEIPPAPVAQPGGFLRCTHDIGKEDGSENSIGRRHRPRPRQKRRKVINLGEALNEERTCVEAAECIRELIEEVRLVPKNGELSSELYGELAALINLANGRPRFKETGVQVMLVAGARNQRCLHLDHAIL
jgi:hypothetical protein